jgi:hypothetical protein
MTRHGAKLLPVAVRDALIRDLVETTRYVDPVTGDPYAPAVPPLVIDPEGDEDAA